MREERSPNGNCCNSYFGASGELLSHYPSPSFCAMKLFFRNIHLYLSLVSGLIIAVVCLTGSVLVFEKELEQAWHPERYFVTPESRPALPLTQLSGAVAQYKPGAKISGIKI